MPVAEPAEDVDLRALRRDAVREVARRHRRCSRDRVGNRVVLLHQRQPGDAVEAARHVDEATDRRCAGVGHACLEHRLVRPGVRPRRVLLDRDRPVPARALSAERVELPVAREERHAQPGARICKASGALPAARRRRRSSGSRPAHGGSGRHFGSQSVQRRKDDRARTAARNGRAHGAAAERGGGNERACDGRKRDVPSVSRSHGSLPRRWMS